MSPQQSETLGTALVVFGALAMAVVWASADWTTSGEASLAFGVGAGLLTMAPPVALNVLIVEVLPSGDPWTLVALSAALLPLALIAAAATTLRGMTLMRIEGRVAARLTAALWDRLLRCAGEPGRTHGDTWVRAMVFQTLRDQLGGAVAAALPPLDPPGTLSVSQGFFTGPK